MNYHCAPLPNHQPPHPGYLTAKGGPVIVYQPSNGIGHFSPTPFAHPPMQHPLPIPPSFRHGTQQYGHRTPSRVSAQQHIIYSQPSYPPSRASPSPSSSQHSSIPPTIVYAPNHGSSYRRSPQAYPEPPAMEELQAGFKRYDPNWEKRKYQEKRRHS